MEIKRKYSILYPDFEGVSYKQLSETACHDLALDTLCRKVSDDPKESKLILETLSQMTADPRLARYRQQVFSDILKFPQLRLKMTELFDKFEFIRNFGVLHRNTDEKQGIWHLLRRMDELNDYITCVEAMQACLVENPVESEGLRGFKDYVDELYHDAKFGEMKADIAALSIQSSEVKSVTVGINVNERFETTEVGLISINNKHFKKSGIVSTFADAISMKEKIQEGTDWDGDMHFHPVESVPDGTMKNDFFVNNTRKRLIGNAPSAGAEEKRATVAKVPGGDGMANFTFYLSGLVNKMLDALLRKLRDTLNKYADVAVVNISQLIPEFIYYIRFAEFIEKYMCEGYSFCPAMVTESDKLMEARGFYNLKLAVSGLLRKIL